VAPPHEEAARELILFRLNRLASASGQPLIRYCEGRFAISRREWRLIAILGRSGACGSTELSERASLQPGPTSKALSLLCDKGLVTRHALPNDRRHVLIELTPPGQEIFDALHPLVLALNERLLSALSDDERRMLDAIVTKLERHVASWMDDTELPKADRRHRHRGSAGG
jgi:DNA-binding MarR family transcriptional regulator